MFYIQHLCDLRRSAVLQGRISGINHQNDDSTLDICETPSLSSQMPSIIEEHEVHDIHANCNVHDEGLWENIPM